MLELICKELGVEVGDEWVGVGIHQNPPTYKIQDNTLWIYHKFNHEDENNWKEASMADYVALIKGELKPMEKPRTGEVYYIPAADELDKYIDFTWTDCDDDEINYSRGLVFKTKKEAIECTNKMLSVIK